MPSDLINCFEAEGRAFDFVKSQLGSDLNFVQDIINQYDALQAQAVKSKRTSEKLAAMTLLRTNCTHNLLAGVLAMMRGHLTFAEVHHRAAIESCLFSLNLFERNESAGAWLNMEHNYEKYRDEFKIMRLLDPKKYNSISPGEKPVVEKLIERYEMTCLMVHASSGALQANMSKDLTKITFIESVTVNDLLLRYWWHLDTHLLIGRLLASKFEKELRNLSITLRHFSR